MKEPPPSAHKTGRKMVALDPHTYEQIHRMAAEECRSIPGQIKWLLKIAQQYELHRKTDNGTYHTLSEINHVQYPD